MNAIESNGKAALDTAKEYGKNAMNAGENMAPDVRPSMSSLNPLNYLPSWMQPSNIAQTGSQYLHRMGETAKQWADAGVHQGKELTKGGLRQSADMLNNVGQYRRSFVDRLSSGTQDGMQKFNENVDVFNGYVAEKLYRTADGVGSISNPIQWGQYY